MDFYSGGCIVRNDAALSEVNDEGKNAGWEIFFFCCYFKSGGGNISMMKELEGDIFMPSFSGPWATAPLNVVKKLNNWANYRMQRRKTRGKGKRKGGTSKRN